MIYLGIDLGTSAVKILAVSEKGKVLSSVSEEYPVFYPHPGWSEQNPSDWWNGVCRGLKRLSKNIDMSDVAGIGVAGQMHGLVVLDSSGEVKRRALIGNRKHRIRGFHGSENTLDEGKRAGKFQENQKDNAPQGLHSIYAHRSPYMRLFRRFRHASAGCQK